MRRGSTAIASILTIFACARIASAASDSIVVEFETGSLAGNATVSSSGTGFTGIGYVTGIKGAGDKATVSFSVPTAQAYELFFRYRISGGDKGVNITVDGTAMNATLANTAGAWAEQFVGKIPLTAGNHSLTAGEGWGWYDLDRLVIRPVVILPVPAVAALPCDPKASPGTVATLQWLQGLYGKKTISGQHGGGGTSDMSYIQSNSGKQPALRSYDFLPYSLSRRAFGDKPGNLAEQAVAFADTGVLSCMWHWCAPDVSSLYNTTAEPWYMGFYTAATSFNISTVLANPNSSAYKGMLNDLDTIAAQLLKAQAKGKTVIWRPLHEASGGWFWWGAQGPTPFKQLWSLMYDRFVNTHGLHNLIWVFTVDPSASLDWYPGDNMVDVLGIDTYNSTSAAQVNGSGWDALQKTFSGKKLLAMSENGTMPSISGMRQVGARWLWFNTWSGFMIPADNPASLVDSVYHDTDVVTLDKLKATGWPPKTTDLAPRTLPTRLLPVGRLYTVDGHRIGVGQSGSRLVIKTTSDGAVLEIKP